VFTVSINPTYFCNFRCDFCYLTSEQLADQNKIELDKLDKLLADIPSIDYVDLYGGEIGALKKDYFYGLKDTIRKHYTDEINIITNYSMLHEGFYEDDVYLSVSYDFEAREKYDKVYYNMLQSPVPIAVLILASPRVIKMDVNNMIQQLNLCTSIESVEIKPYSINQANAHAVTHKQFEEFVIKWIESSTTKRFHFVNEDHIKDSLEGTYNAFSDNHIYITPNGKYGVLEFDADDKEYFLELDTWQDYIKWTQKEKLDNVSDICRNCKYFGTCLTEHYRYVNDLDNSCNGYKGLLEYMEAKSA
jgi:sulfatase maturation enzyme AslB (radical SAM superfamily)